MAAARQRLACCQRRITVLGLRKPTVFALAKRHVGIHVYLISLAVDRLSILPGSGLRSTMHASFGMRPSIACMPTCTPCERCVDTVCMPCARCAHTRVHVVCTLCAWHAHVHGMCMCTLCAWRVNVQVETDVPGTLAKPLRTSALSRFFCLPALSAPACRAASQCSARGRHLYEPALQKGNSLILLRDKTRYV